MPSFRDLTDIAPDLSRRTLPFTWYSMGPEGRSFHLDVALRDHSVAAEYFATHPLELADGTAVPVTLSPRCGDSWYARPSTTTARDDGFDHEQLVGLDVDDAAARATAAGWLVRAHEPEAVLTADFNPGRLNLRYGVDREVQSTSRG